MIQSTQKYYLGLLLALIALFAGEANAQWRTQTISLEPGWNSVFLEVDPYPARCDLQFKGLPINSVWTWSPSFSTVQFIQDPGDLLPEMPDFRVFYPLDQPHHIHPNLELNIPCQVISEMSKDGRYQNIVQVLPPQNGGGRF